MANSLATLLAPLRKRHYTYFTLPGRLLYYWFRSGGGEEWVNILIKEGFEVSPKLVLEPFHELRWLGKLLSFDEQLGIFNLNGAWKAPWLGGCCGR